MTLLPPIDSRFLNRIQNECSKSLLCLLNRLCNGELVRIPDPRSKRTSKTAQEAALKNENVIRYLSAIRDFHRDYDLLVAPPKRLLCFALEMCRLFSSCCADPAIAKIVGGQIIPLFDYEKFRLGKMLSLTKTPKCKSRFAWRNPRSSCFPCNGAIDDLLQYYHETIRYCPYCNAAPIYYYNNADGTSKRKNPFDHFFPKSSFPFLALSLYNLIPVCDRCNREKSNHFSPDELIAYPHLDDLNQLVVFHPMIASVADLYGVSRSRDSFKILIDPTGKDQQEGRGARFIKALLLEPFYDANFRTEAKDVAIKAARFTPAYQEIIQRWCSLRDIAEVQRLVFGTPLQSGDIHKHFLAKMTIDIHDFVQGEVLANNVKK